MQEDDRSYEKTEKANCCCCGSPVSPVDPPYWKVINPKTSEVLLTIPRIASVREYVFSIKGKNGEVSLHLNRPTTCCCGDFRDLCCCFYRLTDKHDSTINLANFRENIQNKEIYNGMEMKNSRGQLLYHNYGDIACCKCCKNEKSNCCEDGGYFADHSWRDPDTICFCVDCISCKCCCPKPYKYDASILSVKGVAHPECTATVEYPRITDVSQSNKAFRSNSTNIYFTGDILYEEKIAIVLFVVDDKSDDDYDMTHLPCYCCSVPIITCFRYIDFNTL